MSEKSKAFVLEYLEGIIRDIKSEEVVVADFEIEVEMIREAEKVIPIGTDIVSREKSLGASYKLTFDLLLPEPYVFSEIDIFGKHHGRITDERDT